MIEKPNPEMENWCIKYNAFIDLRKTLNQHPKFVRYGEENKKPDNTPGDFKELLSKMKEDLLNTLPNTKDFVPNLLVLNAIIYDEYLEQDL